MRPHHDARLFAYYGEVALRSFAAPAGNRSADRFVAPAASFREGRVCSRCSAEATTRRRVCAAPCARVRASSSASAAIISGDSRKPWPPSFRTAAWRPSTAGRRRDWARRRSRVTFHPFCLGVRDKAQELSWPGIVRRLGLTGPPAALKADIEGFEWDVFDALARSGAESLLPFSLSDRGPPVDGGERCPGRWRRPEETAAWMETLRTSATRSSTVTTTRCAATAARSRWHGSRRRIHAAGAPARIPAALPAELRDDLQTKIRIAEPPLAVVRIPNSLAERTDPRTLPRPTHRSKPSAHPPLARAGVTRRGRDAR